MGFSFSLKLYRFFYKLLNTESCLNFKTIDFTSERLRDIAISCVLVLDQINLL